MMTLEEAIKHCKDVALSCTNKKCALEHFQLLKWLQEYSNMLEKQVQKPADNVKPKFKIGDWVVRGKTIAQILDIQEQYYIGLDIDGNDFTSSKFLNDDKIHLWTISDAKDGDVLMWDNGRYIILFKEIKNNIIAHCSYNTHSKHFGFHYDYDTLFDCILNFRPATKKQRDLLFQKMTEDGYEWDAEKKELKKIEQKQEDESELSDFESALFTAFSDAWQQYLRGEEVNVAQWAKEHSEELLDVIQKQNPAWSEWSEEDEEIHRKCICAMRASACGFLEEEKFVEQVDNWLKSLKDRV